MKEVCVIYLSTIIALKRER